MEADGRTSRGLIPDSGESRSWAGIVSKLAVTSVIKLVRYLKTGDRSTLTSRSNIRRTL